MLKRVFLAGAFCLISSTSWAACFQDGTFTTSCHPATQYEVEIQKVELCKSATCTNAVTVASSTASFDIGSVGAGAAVGNYANLDSVPAGVYTHVRTTISPTITFTASASTATPAGNCTSGRTNFAETYDTTEVTSAELTSNSSFGISWNSGNTAFEHLYELTTAVAISKSGSLPQIQVDFATQQAALCIGPAGSANMYPGIPDIDIRVFNN